MGICHRCKREHDGPTKTCATCKPKINARFGTEKYKRWSKTYGLKWRATEVARKLNRKKAALARKRKPEQYRARLFVVRAVRSGKLVRPSVCSRCSKPATRRDGQTAIQAHHKDYNKPLEVIWLCPQCHKDVHLGLLEVA